MDIAALVGAILSSFGAALDWASNRPRLEVEIAAFRFDPAMSRWVLRASVLNRGRVRATGCEGFWSVFDARGRGFESGTGFSWCPTSDDDYDLMRHGPRFAALEPHERRFCYAELDVRPEPVAPSETRLFPYDAAPGMYSMAVIVACGKRNSFDFVGLSIPETLSSSMTFGDVMELVDVTWQWRRGFRAVMRRRRLGRFISRCDYHEEIRPV